MTFIIDAHLPPSLVSIIEQHGHKAMHTSNLKEGNASSDTVIISLAVDLSATVISKDEDFYYSFILKRQPAKLIMVKVGNMKLKDLKKLFSDQFPAIVDLLGQYDLIEIHSDSLIPID